MTDKIKQQIKDIVKSGRTNMFSVNEVQVIANELGYFELVIFIEEHKKEYIDFILYGDKK